MLAVRGKSDLQEIAGMRLVGGASPAPASSKVGRTNTRAGPEIHLRGDAGVLAVPEFYRGGSRGETAS